MPSLKVFVTFSGWDHPTPQTQKGRINFFCGGEVIHFIDIERPIEDNEIKEKGKERNK